MNDGGGRARGRLLRAGAVSTLLAATGGLVAASAEAKRHRVRPPGPVLYGSTGVTEREWSLTPSHRRFRAGPIAIRVYNYGMDDHDFAIVDVSGATIVSTSTLPASIGGKPSSADLVTSLGPGRCRLVCSLFADQPAASHEAKGMVAWITVY